MKPIELKKHSAGGDVCENVVTTDTFGMPGAHCIVLCQGRPATLQVHQQHEVALHGRHPSGLGPMRGQLSQQTASIMDAAEQLS